LRPRSPLFADTIPIILSGRGPERRRPLCWTHASSTPVHRDTTVTWLLLIVACLVAETVVIVALGRQVTAQYDAEHPPSGAGSVGVVDGTRG
jgi:hypothetical protein